jgi:hypothetical protein
MTDTHAIPPRWASALLRASVRLADIESVPGDLLEEYREVRRPSLGRRRADLWYVAQAFSILWRLVWPFVLAMVALRFASFPLARGWNPSLVPAANVSLLDAAILASAGYYGARRGGRILAGVVTAGAAGVLGFAAFLIYAAAWMPGLVLAPFEKPFIFVIVLTLFAIAFGFAISAGAVGALIGRSLPPKKTERPA